MTNTQTPASAALAGLRSLFGSIALFLLYHLLSFRGRIGRLKFVAISILVAWPLILTILLDDVMELPELLSFFVYTFSVLYLIFGLLGAVTRRLHDLGRSGGYSLFANIIWPILAAAPGNKDENNYGPAPVYQPAWALALMLWPLLISGYWLKDYLNPADKTLVTHDLTEHGIYTYHVGDAWGGMGRSNCCVRIKGQYLDIVWSKNRPREEPGQRQERWGRESHTLTVANPARQPEQTFLHVHFLPDEQVRLGWSADNISPLQDELAERYPQVQR